MGKNILITGGTGLVGQAVREQLTLEGHHVAVLTRHPDRFLGEAFHWDPDRGFLDVSSLDFADVVIHLAGENISSGRWTRTRKQKILDSRVNTSRMLMEGFQRSKKKPELFIAASAVGYYGAVTKEHTFRETDPPGDDFLARTTVAWEQASGAIEQLGIRTVILRLGVVFSPDGGALQKMMRPVRWGLGAPLGHGRQMVPWIAVEDVAGMVSFFINTPEISGIYNAVAPEVVTNRSLMQLLAKHLGKPFFLPAVPAFLLRLMFGEMSIVLLEGSPVSAEKIIHAGYPFRFPTLNGWLKEKSGSLV